MAPARKPAISNPSARRPADDELQPDIIALDPSQPVHLKPVIADLLRTRYCIPGSVFLVEGIENHIPVSSRWRTVRVLLGDGELVLQALVRPEIHSFLKEGGQIYEGGYVRVDRFDLNWVEVDVGGGEAKGREKRKMPFLVVEDMTTVGWDRRWFGMVGAKGPPISKGSLGREVGMGRWAGRREESGGQKGEVLSRSRQSSTEGEEEGGIEQAEESDFQKGGSAQLLEGPPGELMDSPAKDGSGEKEAGEEDTDYLSDSDDAFETLQVSEQRAASRRTQVIPKPPCFPPKSSPKARSTLPWMAHEPTQPMKLTNLQSIPKLPYKQNWMVNVLAVVAWLSDVEPTYLPPGRQRRARIVDPTTDKHVWLTVLLDPEEFTPQLGSVVLLVGVKNHQFDGGSLRKYTSDKPKSKQSWWVENPMNLWCHEEATGLRQWWNGRAEVEG